MYRVLGEKTTLAGLNRANDVGIVRLLDQKAALLDNEPGDLRTRCNEELMMAMHWQDYVEERKDVMMGKPVFKGTRLTVEHILKELGTGMSTQELLDNYPTLRAEHIRAAMLYAAAVVTMDETIYQ
jgi:uncharacterized protein (DUF433 family)